jgi:hypothetical protein
MMIIIIIICHQCMLTQPNTNYYYIGFNISFSSRLPKDFRSSNKIFICD